MGLEEENLGEPLLIQMIKNGDLIYTLPGLEAIRIFFKSQLSKLPAGIYDINSPVRYPVEISKKLLALFDRIKKEHIES